MYTPRPFLKRTSPARAQAPPGSRFDPPRSHTADPAGNELVPRAEAPDFGPGARGRPILHQRPYHFRCRGVGADPRSLFNR